MEQIIGWDQNLFLLLNGAHCAWLDPVMMFFSNIRVWIPFYLIIVFFLFYKHNWRWGLLALAAVLLTFGLCDQMSAQVIKEAVQRLRPSHTESLAASIHLLEGKGGLYGFVSSHAANVMGLALITSLIFKKKWYSFAIFTWATIVSYSRIYVGKHFPLDVICGAMLGLVLAYLVYLLFLYLERKWKLCD